MLRIRTLGLALVAVFALSAIAASAASAALPEFKAPFPKKFTQTNKEQVVIKDVVGIILLCHSSQSEGEITGAKTGSMTFRLKECLRSLSDPCENAGANTGEIVTSTLSMHVGYINKTTEVGVELEGTGGEVRSEFADYTCNIGGVLIPYKLRSGPIASITPVNTATGAFTLSFPETVIKKLQKEEEHTLWVSINGGVWMREGVSMTTKTDILTEGLTEIIA